MSIVSRILDWWDDPRFCPDCGKPIDVEERQRYDGTTGDPRPLWVWHCPDVSMSVKSDGSVYAEQRRVDFVHAPGTGRPRWHQREG